MLIVFDDMIAEMNNNGKLNFVVTELFIRERKLNISLVFITQSNFKHSLRFYKDLQKMCCRTIFFFS